MASFAVASAAATALCAGTTAPVSATGDRTTQQQIARAFRSLIELPSVARGAVTLQAYDGEMRAALQAAGQRLVSNDDGRRTSVTESTGAATVVRRDEATVPLTITVRTEGARAPSDGIRFSAVALRLQGNWKVSWTTMCLLVESGDQLCPSPPAHTETGDILPLAVGSPLGPTGASPGIVDPGPLAIAPDGGVLIADHDRNQILEWRDGALSVVAGDALQGFSGDGGPAVDAELNAPGEIAVARTGTIYFVDSGNNRVRAVAPDGTITTVAGDGSLGDSDVGDGDRATEVPLDPSGVAVAPSGALYVSSNSDIRVVEPDGLISTLVRGGPPYGVDVQVGGIPTAFFPTWLALESDGALVAFAFSPKTLFLVGPAGQVTQLAQDYANALSTAPDGSVLVAEHGDFLERVAGTSVVRLPPPQVEVPGLRSYLVAEGIAQAADGTTYVDTELDGFSAETSLLAISGGVARPVPIGTPPTSTLPGSGAPGFPAATYPPSRPGSGRDAALPSCPSMQGVVPFTRAAERQARQLLGFWGSGFSYDLHASDRAWWSGVVATSGGGRLTVGPMSPAAASLYAQPIAAACGTALVKDSLAVLMEPSPYDISYQHVFLLDRDGTPLVYFAAS